MCEVASEQCHMLYSFSKAMQHIHTYMHHGAKYMGDCTVMIIRYTFESTCTLLKYSLYLSTMLSTSMYGTAQL